MIAYFDCFSGISGDMIVGALLDAGVPFDWLRDELGKLPLNGYRLEVEDVKRGGIGGKRFRVIVEVEQSERKLGDIKKIIENSTLSDDVKDLSIKVFERLAEAEARVHRVGVDEIHFHEVGGIDSIIDIVSSSLSLSYLRIDRVYSSEVALSQGTVSCSHGLLPLPAPAVMELLTGVPVYQAGVRGELVTPTGAAFLSVVCEGFGAIRPMRLKSTGYGAGERENEGLPNLLRVMIGEEYESTGVKDIDSNPLEVDSVMVIDANIDDMNPEIYGFVMDRLLDEGALDVSLTPVYMKKGRPGTLLKVICQVGKEREMADILLRETSTIGVRFYRTDRLKVCRESVEVQTRFGKVNVKVAKTPWNDKAQPEYDDCRKLALEKGVPIREVYTEAMKEFERGGYERQA
ncbi:MAG: nickel pincer cofactor biosynthesis protein LarC [Deltaproteobacteria bacterium]|nr:nickel pincer cofactor biosynthesis protein LarC [Deltaproteobacteria bacterium]